MNQQSKLERNDDYYTISATTYIRQNRQLQKDTDNLNLMISKTRETFLEIQGLYPQACNNYATDKKTHTKTNTADWNVV